LSDKLITIKVVPKSLVKDYLDGGPQPQQQNIVCGADRPWGEQPRKCRPARCV